MSRHRLHLPQLSDATFATDGGLETTLIFHKGLDLPEFASFVLLRNPEGRQALIEYYLAYIDIAVRHGVGLILESPTWRSNPDWGAKLGYTAAMLEEANADAIGMMMNLRTAFESAQTPFVVSGCIGPRGDGYVPSAIMSAREAEDYHRAQIHIFAAADADMVSALTMNYVDEAIGIANAASSLGMPVAISFTLETDGRLPTGQSLQAAIEATDAATNAAPAYYMINCAHPTHFAHNLQPDGAWVRRIRGLRANASRMSHAELNESTTLDDGNPRELAQQYRDLRKVLTALNIIGGCCGTDHRHVDAICELWKQR